MSSEFPVGSFSQSDIGSRSLVPEALLEGHSPAITRVRTQIYRAAPHFRMAFLTGERGSGAEAVAHMLHHLSPVSHRPFYTLATADAEERFAADRSLDSLSTNGMLYLPQTECIPLTILQALLRLIRKRGSQMPRIAAFTEWGLRPLVKKGSLSSELANVLGALVIKIPSLRDRSEDIPAILTHILENIARPSGAVTPQLTTDLLDAAMKRPWFGNLIELYSAAEGLMKHAAKGSLHASDLEAVLGPIPCETRTMRLDDVIRLHVRTVLFACHGDKRQAAQLLGISSSSLYRMLHNETHAIPESIQIQNLQPAESG
ncbi:MAG TPA: sigma 54-interacting transcriptional regulator [Acidobacteriaceae bacterium]|nr:sigma 54-interacting transcriptional regulator [Acidobacteriaceae bacterium]